MLDLAPLAARLNTKLAPFSLGHVVNKASDTNQVRD
jgi:hypothetical protein